MLAYPITLEADGETILATSQDFPELATFGDNQEDALARASDALEEAIAARIHDRKDIPYPSMGVFWAFLPTLTAAKVALYRAMRERGVSKAELALRLGWHMPQVDRILDLNHRSRMDGLDAALGALNLRLLIKSVHSSCWWPDPMADESNWFAPNPETNPQTAVVTEKTPSP